MIRIYRAAVVPCFLVTGLVLGVRPSYATRVALWSATAVRSAQLNVLAGDPANPAVFYAGDSSGHLYRSMNGGRTMTRARATLNGAMRAVAVDPTRPLTVYVLTTAGLWRSTTGGDAYSHVGQGLPAATSLHDLSLVSSTDLYVGGDGGAWRSTNQGASFARVGLQRSTTPGAGMAVWAVVADVRIARRLYAASSAGIEVSKDGGHTWNLDDSPGAVVRLAVVPRAPGGVYLLTPLGNVQLFRGDGLQDVLTQIVLPENTDVSDISVGAAGQLLVGTHGAGIIQTLDGGLSWQQVGGGLPGQTALLLSHGLTATSSVFYALTSQGVYRLTER